MKRIVFLFLLVVGTMNCSPPLEGCIQEREIFQKNDSIYLRESFERNGKYLTYPGIRTCIDNEWFYTPVHYTGCHLGEKVCFGSCVCPCEKDEGYYLCDSSCPLYTAKKDIHCKN
jgi:hypothetical protein